MDSKRLLSDCRINTKLLEMEEIEIGGQFAWGWVVLAYRVTVLSLRSFPEAAGEIPVGKGAGDGGVARD